MAGSFGTTGRGPRLLPGGGRKATIVSTVSTLVVLGAIAAVLWLAPGSAAFRHAFFSPANMWQAFVGDPNKGYYPVGEAIWLNIRMFLSAEVMSRTGSASWRKARSSRRGGPPMCSPPRATSARSDSCAASWKLAGCSAGRDASGRRLAGRRLVSSVRQSTGLSRFLMRRHFRRSALSHRGPECGGYGR